jgi:tRNA threonylcarbamoyladenosine biosynthesis protein TsaE
MEHSIITHSPDETMAFGVQLTASLKAGDTVALFGQLGSGKTVLTKGLGQGLGVITTITSPTFTLMHQYQGRVPVYHFDLYRLDNAAQLRDIGFDEYCGTDGICIIEWAEKCVPLLPDNRTEVHLEVLGENERHLQIVRPYLKL